MQTSKKGLAVLLALLLAVSLCACTKQRNMDVAEFCERFNAIRGQELLLPEMFFTESAESTKEYNCNFSFDETHTTLLSLGTAEDGTVTNLQLTCIPEGEAPYTSEAFSALFEIYVQLVHVLSVSENTENALHLINAAGITRENLSFADFGFVGKTDAFEYAVFSGEMYLSLFCTRTR